MNCTVIVRCTVDGGLAIRRLWRALRGQFSLRRLPPRRVPPYHRRAATWPPPASSPCRRRLIRLRPQPRRCRRLSCRRPSWPARRRARTGCVPSVATTLSANTTVSGRARAARDSSRFI